MRNRIAPVLVATLIFACSSNSTNQDDNTGGSDGNSSMTFALSGGDFTNNSVRICGSRTAPDPKYRCNSSLTPDIEAGTDAGDACPCFNFNADGSLVDGTGAPAVITGLCPSADYPPANWDFSYALFASPNCQGTQLNDGEHNFTCYDSKDIATQQSPNQSIDEVLVSGPNTNHILCNTENASKQWDFTSCARTTTPADTAVGLSRYDCNCAPAAGNTCDCGNGLGPSDLEAGCSFDPLTCNIVCGSSESALPQGSCLGSVSQSVLVNGTDVISYVPHGQWNFQGVEGVSVVHVEGSSSGTSTLIPTGVVVNSCASNSVTGRTVCTGDDTTVYIFSGLTLQETLQSDAESFYPGFSGGTCQNCGVTMDPVHNRALLTMGLAVNNGGFQFLDLNTDSLLPPFEARTLDNEVSESVLVDPIRNLILSPIEVLKYFDIIDVADPLAPQFFERGTDLGPILEPDSAGEDCETGIALAPGEMTGAIEGEVESMVYIADLTQSTFTPGNPGSWAGAAQGQTLTESFLQSGASAVAVAQGTHQGIINGEVHGSAMTAIQLPSISGPGTGTPAIVDWVTCKIPGFDNGIEPHTTTAYKSPNTGHAMAIIVNDGATQMAVVDLTMMLDPTIVPRTSGPGLGHACASDTLPPAVVHFITIR